jgi:putative endonuclease
MKYFVYILKSLKYKQRYIGLTKDLSIRLKEHNSGFTRSTKPYIPWEVLFFEEFNSFEEARNKEKYYKTAAGRRFLKEILV